MKLTELFIAELDREAARTQRVLEAVPVGHDDFKPHEKSMPFGRLAALVASMPSWISLVIDTDELDLNPPNPPKGGGSWKPPATSDLVSAHDGHITKGRASLAKTTDDHLLTTNWKLLVGGNVVANDPRHVVLRDTMHHLAHHRGQLTVYLRLLNLKVPATYGPSADDQRFL